MAVFLQSVQQFIGDLCSDPIHSFEGLSYLGIFILAGLGGHFLPIPEDVVMLLTGYVAALGIVDLGKVVVVAVAAVVIADITIFYLSLNGSRFVEKIINRVKANVFTRFVEAMRTHSLYMVFISRFVPGLRLLGPITAGYVRVRPFVFVVCSIVSALVYVPLMVGLGFLFHSKIAPLIGVVETTSHTIFGVVLVVVSVSVAVPIYRKFFKRVGP